MLALVIVVLIVGIVAANFYALHKNPKTQK